MKVVNISGEGSHILWTTSEILMEFSGMTWLLIILEATKSKGFNPSLENTILEKNTGEVKLTPSPAYLYGIFYPTAKILLRHGKKIVLITWLLSENIYIFNMESRRLQHIHFTVYSIMNIITAFSIHLQLHGILLIALINQKGEQQTILN